MCHIHGWETTKTRGRELKITYCTLKRLTKREGKPIYPFRKQVAKMLHSRDYSRKLEHRNNTQGNMRPRQLKQLWQFQTLRKTLRFASVISIKTRCDRDSFEAVVTDSDITETSPWWLGNLREDKMWPRQLWSSWQVAAIWYGKYPKNSDTRKFAVITLKFEQGCFTIEYSMRRNDADGMANSADPQHTAPRGVWSGSTLFA